MILTNKKAVIRLWALLCLIMCISCVQAQQQNEPLPMDPKVRKGTLANGFTYYIRKNTTPEKRALLYLVNKAGSILETDEQRGLAHFLEHMAFNGTKHFPKNELVEYLQKAGVRFGADLNAYTSYDETVYQLPISTADKTVFRNAMLIMQDWAQGLTLDDAEINKERGVILEEKRQRLGAGERIRQQLLPAMVNDSRYADRLPIGVEEVILNFDHKEIRQFYQDWYRPGLQALIVVGDIEVNEVEKMIKRNFSGLKNPSPAKDRVITNIPLTGNNQFITVTDPEVASINITMQVKHPTEVIQGKTDFKDALVRQLFNILAADRLGTILQQDDAPFLSANFRIGELIANLDAFTASLTVKPNAVQQGIIAWLRELERVKLYGFSAPELKRAILNYQSTLDQVYKERNNTASENYVKEYTRNFLKGEASAGIEYEYTLTKSILDTLTTAGVQDYIRRYLTDTNRDISIIGSTNLQDSIPQEEMMAAWIKETEKESVQPYTDRYTVRTKLMEQLPVPGTITAETKGPDGTTLLTLGNGVKVVLKPTHFQKDNVLFSAQSAGGLSQVSDEDFYSAGIASELVLESGVSDLSANELNRLLTGKNVSVVPYINETADGISGQSSATDLETALQLTYLYFTRQRKDPGAFNRFKEQVRLSYETLDQDPMALFRDSLSAILGGYHFRKVKPSRESLDKIDMERALVVFRERFSDAGGFTFTFVGSFDIEKIKPLLTQYLGSLPAAGRKNGIRDLHLNYPTGVINKKIIHGSEEKGIVALAFTGPFNFDQETVIRIEALSNIIVYRLRARLREEEAGIYNVNVSPSFRKYPTGQYALIINFVCDPKRLEMLIISATAELMKMKTKGIDPDDLAKYKATAKSSISRARQSNNFWLNYLFTQLSNHEPVDADQLEKMIQKISLKDMNDAATRFLDYGNYITVTLKPVR